MPHFKITALIKEREQEIVDGDGNFEDMWQDRYEITTIVEARDCQEAIERMKEHEMSNPDFAEFRLVRAEQLPWEFEYYLGG